MLKFKEKTAELLHVFIPEFTAEELFTFLENPKDKKRGDCAFPCFQLAKKRGTNPMGLAAGLASSIDVSKSSGGLICSVEAAGGYLNFTYDPVALISAVLGEIVEKRDSYGCSAEGMGRKVVIDYSSPNIAKPFHIGLLYGTLLGNSLYRMYNFLGYSSFGINYLGDWGTQFGKLIVGYKLWSNGDDVRKGRITELLRVYVKFHAEAEDDPALEDDARAWLIKMQNGDAEAMSLWKWFREITLEECNRMYERLGIHFDSYNGESFYNDKMGAVVDELKEKALLEEDAGAMIVRLDAYKMPPCLILRSDGGTLYPTRDIASALYRKKEYDFHKSIYITDQRQALHFAQWFKVVELMGYEWAKDMAHVPYGYISLKNGAMATRKGNFVLIEDLLNDAKAKVMEVIEVKNPALEGKEEVAEQVALGAIIFGDLYNSRVKDVVFDLEKILSFEGETGPYLQYTHARACSVLEKAGEWKLPEEAAYSNLTDEDSVELVKLLSGLTDAVRDAAARYEPFLAARYAMAVAQSFNKFYHNNPILSSEGKLRDARLALVFAAKTVLAIVLDLLGMKAPQKM